MKNRTDHPINAMAASRWSPYVYDAGPRTMMLLGGVTGQDVPEHHDWYNLLSRLGMVEAHGSLALLVHAAGVLVVLSALAWGGAALWLEWRAARQ